MVSTLVVGTNTYQLQAAADALLEDHIATPDWVSVGSDDKARALITAFNVMENLVWQGTKTGTAQHPRTGLTNCNGDAVSSASVGSDILLAQAILAYEYSQDTALADSSSTGAELKRAVAGSAEVEFFQKARTFGANPLSAYQRLPTVVKDLLKCYLSAGASTGLGAPTITGTSAGSSFCEHDSEFNGGLA